MKTIMILLTSMFILCSTPTQNKKDISIFIHFDSSMQRDVNIYCDGSLIDIAAANHSTMKYVDTLLVPEGSFLRAKIFYNYIVVTVRDTTATENMIWRL